MYIDFEHPDELVSAITDTLAGRDATVMLLLADHHSPQAEDIIEALNEAGVKFFGAIFPGLIDRHAHREKGANIHIIDNSSEPIIIDLTADGPVIPDTLPELPGATDACTGFVFADAFAPKIASLLERLFDHYGNTISYFGAGAGDRALQGIPDILSNRGVFQSAAVFCIADHGSHGVVRHGWQHLMGPFITTKTDNNLIKEFGWKNAGKIYINALPEEKRKFSPGNFYHDVGAEYPLSIQKEGAEDVIRDAVDLTEDGDLVFLTEIPENCVMYMVHAKPQWLIDAAAKAVGESLSTGTGNRIIVADCYGRKLVLEDAFNDELAGAYSRAKEKIPDVDFFGVIALGEIATSAGRSLELYNKTFVALRMDVSSEQKAG